MHRTYFKRYVTFSKFCVLFSLALAAFFISCNLQLVISKKALLRKSVYCKKVNQAKNRELFRVLVVVLVKEGKSSNWS